MKHLNFSNLYDSKAGETFYDVKNTYVLLSRDLVGIPPFHEFAYKFKLLQTNGTIINLYYDIKYPNRRM
jgi:hypothetical protein